MRPAYEGSSTTISTSRDRSPESAEAQPASSEASSALSRACKRRSTSFNRLIPATGQRSFTTRTFPEEQCASPSFFEIGDDRIKSIKLLYDAAQYRALGGR